MRLAPCLAEPNPEPNCSRLSAPIRSAGLCLLLALTAGCAKAHPPQPAAPASAAAREAAPGSAKDGPASTPTPASPAVAQLRAEADAAFGDPSVNALWGVEIQSLDTGEVLYTRNAHALVMPASNMKILTMSVAATRLGWDYRFTTTLETTGTVSGGVLKGDLVVVGSGDPTISDRGGAPMRVFESWADQLRAAGITRIDGRIVGDDDRFDDRPLGDGWAWDDMAYGYSAPGGALQFNEDIVRVIVTPDAVPGQPARVRLEPEGSGLTLRSAVTTGAAVADNGVNLSRQPNSTALYVSGTVAAGGKESSTTAAVDNPTIFFVNALRATLVRKGIEVTGAAIDIDDLPAVANGTGTSAPPSNGAVATSATAAAATPAAVTRRVLLTHQSPPLSEIGVTFMKVSQNLFGETLMTTIGERATQADATLAGEASPTPPGWPVNRHHAAAAHTVYEQVLGGWGIPRSEFVLVDGSGLSRYNFVTPHLLVRILRRMARDPAMGPTFEATLPIGGKDGTLGPRMKGTKSENNVQAKTGSLANVRALSGYVRTTDGERLVFSIVANNFNVPTPAIDAITDLVVERLANFTRNVR
jgi:D-alanyl-D-alanine carboxypeptidase/D-alanyl-D-alanine-endopeptidase (penicillin-binding protein 4)